MRQILFYIIQTLLVLTFLNVAYLPTLRIDFFGGNSNADGLYLLSMPMVFLPTILIVSVIKYFVTKKLKSESIYKWSFLISIASGVICTLLIVADALWATIIISMLTVIVIVAETLVHLRQRLTTKTSNV